MNTKVAPNVASGTSASGAVNTTTTTATKNGMMLVSWVRAPGTVTMAVFGRLRPPLTRR